MLVVSRKCIRGGAFSGFCCFLGIMLSLRFLPHSICGDPIDNVHFISKFWADNTNKALNLRQCHRLLAVAHPFETPPFLSQLLIILGEKHQWIQANDRKVRGGSRR